MVSPNKSILAANRLKWDTLGVLENPIILGPGDRLYNDPKFVGHQNSTVLDSLQVGLPLNSEISILTPTVLLSLEIHCTPHFSSVQRARISQGQNASS